MNYISCYEEPNNTGYKELFVDACITGNLHEAKTVLQKTQILNCVILKLLHLRL
jgi:hypothetical protein